VASFASFNSLYLQHLQYYST